MWLYYLKKIWAWLKGYWYIPVVLILGIVLFFKFGLKRNPMFKYFKKAKESYEYELMILQATNDAYNDKKDKQTKEHEDRVKELNKEHEDMLNVLENNKRNKINSNPDTDELADAINDSLGL
jgi:hypothetical protein